MTAEITKPFGLMNVALSLVPIGGYVAVAGAGAGEVDPADAGAYANKSAWRRFVFVLAGPVMNYVAAVAIAWVLLASVGLGVADPASRVGQLVPGMPAEAAGLRLDRARVEVGAVVRATARLLAPRFETAEVGLDVRTAKVLTLGHEVVDSFYVRRAGGEKVTDPAELEAIEGAVLDAVRR